MLLGSWCGNLTALISAHQSIGVPQPLILFGTEAQKRKYLPRVARGRNFGLRPHGNRGRFRPGGDGHARRAGAGREAFHPQRRKTLVHERHEGRRDCRHGEDAAETNPRRDERPDHGVHRRDGLAGRGSCAPVPVHGLEGALQRRHPFHQRPRAGGKHPARRGQGTARRADDTGHGTIDAARRVRRGGEALPEDFARVGRRTKTMGRAHRQTRGHRGQARRGWRRTFLRWNP